MNITRFIKYLNKTRHWQIQGSYYARIEEWKNWWQGWYESFHLIREQKLNGTLCGREMYRMKMPKRACEDWASLLLNDKTTVTVEDAASSVWLMGEDQEQTGGQLGKLEFWPNANALVELAFRSGTGAFVLGAENLTVQNGKAVPSPRADMTLDYLPAECILPITVRHGKIIDVAFASEVIVNGKSCIYLQTHRLQKDGYHIQNEYFTSQSESSEEAGYQPAPLPEGMAASFVTDSAVPWFAVFSPNIVKTFPEGPGMGMSIFAEALDQAKQCDLAFDNYCRDIFLGGKKVFYSQDLMKAVPDEEGGTRYIPPDDVRQQLFFQTSGGDPDGEPQWHEYNPDLRVEANGKAVQDALDYFSFKVGLGTHHYQFDSGNVGTATQYNGDRQDMVQHANRHQIKIEAALLQLFRSMLWMGKELLGAAVDPDTPLTINFDDSYITDSQTRRAQDKDDALSGFIPKYRYNMEWRGMSEAQAKAAVQEAMNEGGGTNSLTFGGDA